MSYANWHVRAVVKLDPANSDAVLIDLLNEHEYERDVATELARLVAPPKAEEGFIRKVDYGGIWEARAGRRKEPHQERRRRYASAIRDRIGSILKERSSVEQKRPYDFRLRTLAVALAAIDSHGSADMVFEVMSLPDEWDSGRLVDAVETLLFNGVALPTDRILAFMDSALSRFRNYGVQQQDEWLVKRLLCILPFIDNPARGIEKIRQLISELRIYSYQLRDVAEAVGHSRCDEAPPFLRELASDKPRAEQLGDAWINAVAAVDSPESRKLLLSFVDPDLPGLPAEIQFGRDDVLMARIIDLARRDEAVEKRLIQLCEADLPPVKRLLLAKVIGRLTTLEAVLAGLNLVDDGVNPSVPYEIWNQVETAFVEKRPYGGSEGTYTLEPRSSNAIRLKLLEMASKDERRKKSAFTLLAQIEEWRLEYGRPPGEPRHPAFETGMPWPPMPAEG